MEALESSRNSSLASFFNTDLTTLPDPAFSIGQDGHLRHDLVLIPQVPYSSSSCTNARYTTHTTARLPRPIRQHAVWTVHIRADAGPLELVIHEAIEPSLWPLVRRHADAQRHFDHPADVVARRSLRFRLTNTVEGQPATYPLQRFHVVVPRLARSEWNRIYRVFLYPRAPMTPSAGIAGSVPLLSSAAVRARELRLPGAVHAPSASYSSGDKAADALESFADLHGVRLPASTVDTCRTWARVSSWHAVRQLDSFPTGVDALPEKFPVRPRDLLLETALPDRWHRSVSAGPEPAFPQLREEERESEVSKALWAFIDGFVDEAQRILVACSAIFRVLKTMGVFVRDTLLWFVRLMLRLLAVFVVVYVGLAFVVLLERALY